MYLTIAIAVIIFLLIRQNDLNNTIEQLHQINTDIQSECRFYQTMYLELRSKTNQP